MKKLKNISMLVLICSLLLIGVLNNTSIIQVSSNLIGKKNANIKSYLDLSEDSIALMDYYLKNTNVTMYSGLEVSSITIYTEKAGKVYIGTAKVEDIVKARINGTAYTSNGKTYDVIAGKNEIPLELTVGENETIVIGGNGSVGVGYDKESTTTDENGKFTLLNGKKNEYIINSSNNKYDKLSLEITTKSTQLIKDFDVFSDVTVNNTTVESGTTGLYSCYMSFEPFIYDNLKLYENSLLTSLQIFVGELEENKNYTFTLSVLDSSTIKAGSVATVIQKHTLTLNASDLKEQEINSIDISKLNIYIEKGQTIGFGTTTDTLPHYYYKGVKSENLKYWGYTSNKLSYRSSNNLIFGVKGTSNIQKITEEKIENEMKNIMKDKKISLLGASIVTYQGYSNNADYNSTIGNNAVYYSSSNLSSVNDTFWMQAINQYDMKLIVNNSWSGSKIMDSNINAAGYATRPTQLHNNDNENPEIVIVYMGLNDHSNGTAVGTLTDDLYNKVESKVDNGDSTVPESFTAGYIEMIYKIKKTYGDVDIYVWGIPNRNKNLTLLSNYNSNIKSIIEHYNGYYLDLPNHPIMSGTNYTNYTIGDNLHPNAEGMDIMTNILLDAFKDTYLLEKANNTKEDTNIQGNEEQNNEEVENPFTSTSLIKIISLVFIVGAIIVLSKTIKTTKINKYE